MSKIKSAKNAGSVTVRPLFGMARHAQVIKAAWAAERHDAPAATAKQPAARRKPGRYGGR
jgi:hypothetical protein